MAVEIERFRREIEQIDEEIVRLFSRRFEIVKKLARLKHELGLPVYDPAREEDVRRRWVTYAEQYGVPREIARSIVDIVLSYSKILQVVDRVSKKWKDRISIAVVGSGNMGKTLFGMFSMFNLRVRIFPARAVLNYADEIAKCDYVVFATRSEYFYTSMFEHLLRKLRKGTVISDILSVKIPHFLHIERLARQYEHCFISTHPLFGPLDIVVGETIVLIPSSSCPENVINMVAELYRDVGLQVVSLSSPEEHDRLMSIIQVAHHLHYLSLMRFLSEYSKVSNIDLKKLCTHSLRQTIQKLERFRQLLTTIIEIQLENKYAKDVRRRVLDEMTRLVTCLDNAQNVEEGIKCVD